MKLGEPDFPFFGLWKALIWSEHAKSKIRSRKRCMWLAWLPQFKRQWYEPLFVPCNISPDKLQDKHDVMWVPMLRVRCYVQQSSESLKIPRSKFTHVKVNENHMHEDLGMTCQPVYPSIRDFFIEFWSLSVENNKARGYAFLLFLVFFKIWNMAG